MNIAQFFDMFAPVTATVIRTARDEVIFNTIQGAAIEKEISNINTGVVSTSKYVNATSPIQGTLDKAVIIGALVLAVYLFKE